MIEMELSTTYHSALECIGRHLGLVTWILGLGIRVLQLPPPLQSLSRLPVSPPRPVPFSRLASKSSKCALQPCTLSLLLSCPS